MSLKKSHFLVAGAAILLAGGLATYVYFRNVALKVSKPLGSAQILPATAVMTAFISPNSQALAQLQELGTPEAQRLIAGRLKRMEEESLAETNISFEKDLQPWVGSVTMALLPTDNPESTEKTDLLVVIGIKNKVKAWNFANKLKEKEDTKVEEKEYKGVTVWEIKEANTETYNGAVLGDYLAIADSFEGMTRAIDTFAGEPSLASRDDAAAIISKSAGVKNPFFTLFVPDYGALMGEFNANLPESERLSPSAINSLNSVKSLVMAGGVDADGVRWRTVTKLNTPLTQPPEPIPGKLLANFPAETMALFSGGGISQIWSELVTQAQNEPTLMSALGLLRQGLAVTGLDADTEIFGWMDGEFAMGAIASNEGLLAQVGLGGAMVWETSDRSNAQKLFDKLDEVATGTAQVSLERANINGKEVTQWQMLGLGSFLGHGWLDENTVFIAAGQPIVELMTSGPEVPLSSSTSFQEATGSLPQPNQGYFYLDTERVVSWLERYPYAASSGYISPEVLTILNSMRGIGVTAVWPDAYTSEVEVLWGLKSIN